MHIDKGFYNKTNAILRVISGSSSGFNFQQNKTKQGDFMLLRRLIAPMYLPLIADRTCWSKQGPVQVGLGIPVFSRSQL